MSKTRVIVLTVITAAIGIGVGVVIGYFTHPSNSENSSTSSYFSDVDLSKVTEFVSQVDATRIRSNLIYFAEKPHMATSPRDVELANYIKDTWTQQLDEAKLTPYEIMHGFLSEDPNTPNQVTIEDPISKEVFFEARKTEVVYPEYMKDPDTIVPYYSSFGPPGDVQGKLIYANFGSDEDYQNLLDKGVTVEGTISLVKYGGGVGRGGKASIANKYRVNGVLVFSDPENWVAGGEVGYPEDASLPGTGVQRGSTLSAFGDPSTPNYPSTDYAYRVKVEDMEGLPPIPLQPVAYDDAEFLMRGLGGPEASLTWSTGFEINTIRVGSGFAAPNQTREVRIKAFNTYNVTTSYNVIGVIYGSEEPDKYVMYGNHRDAWVYGAVDPSSGTSCMMETTRILGNMLSNDWRPRRSILFASWGSEEFGLMGSTEWAEDNLPLLNARAVAYINVDIAVFANQSFYSRASPLMSEVLFDAANIADEMNPGETIKDVWVQNFPSEVYDEKPLINRLSSSSDYGYFYQVIGITSADLSYRGNPSRDSRYSISPYPTYHTGYDTFDYVDRFVDPGFFAHQAVTRVAGGTLLRLSDSLIIPFSMRYFSDLIQSQISQTREQFGDLLTGEGISLDSLEFAGTALETQTDTFHTFIDTFLDRKNLQQVISINDRMLAFERCFIEPNGLPGQPFGRHISGGSGLYDNSSGSFPGIQDAIFIAQRNSTTENWNVVAQQVALATYKINMATKVLVTGK